MSRNWASLTNYLSEYEYDLVFRSSEIWLTRVPLVVCSIVVSHSLLVILGFLFYDYFQGESGGMVSLLIVITSAIIYIGGIGMAIFYWCHRQVGYRSTFKFKHGIGNIYSAFQNLLGFCFIFLPTCAALDYFSDEKEDKIFAKFVEQGNFEEILEQMNRNSDLIFNAIFLDFKTSLAITIYPALMIWILRHVGFRDIGAGFIWLYMVLIFAAMILSVFGIFEAIGVLLACYLLVVIYRSQSLSKKSTAKFTILYVLILWWVIVPLPVILMTMGVFNYAEISIMNFDIEVFYLLILLVVLSVLSIMPCQLALNFYRLLAD